MDTLIKEIESHNKIILLRHIFPDYDAIGSQMALYSFIKDNFKDKKVLLGGNLPKEYRTIGRVDKLQEQDFDKALVIITDTATLNRIDIPNLDFLHSANVVFKIDHHVNVDKYGTFEIVDDTYPATCELLTKLFDSSSLLFSESTAYYLFHGLVTDTDRFMYRSVSSRTFDMASILLSKGINFKKVYENIYSLPVNYMKLKGYILSNFCLTKSGIAYSVITSDILKKFEVSEPHLVSLWVNLLGEVKNVKIWIFFVENIDNCRVEFRSNKISVREIANHFGGGGHETASGAKLDTIADYEKVVNFCEKFIK